MTIYFGPNGITFGHTGRFETEETEKKKKEETKTVWEKLEEELDENGEQKWHVVTDSDLFAGGEVDYGK